MNEKLVHDLIYRDEAIMSINDTEIGMLSQWDIGRNSGLNYAMRKLKELPPVQPEYEQVTAEDFARIMSETSTYSYMAWYSEALSLMKRTGFVICKKKEETINEH